MKRLISTSVASILMATSIAATPAIAQPGHNRPLAPQGHEFRPPPPPDAHWDRGREPPPYWNNQQWRYRQSYLRRHGHRDDDNDATFGLIAGVILGFVLGAAVSDSQERQAYAQSHLDDNAWTDSCSRRYRSFDRYSGTYLGRDGLRHYCR
jgi:hypothetical protein